MGFLNLVAQDLSQNVIWRKIKLLLPDEKSHGLEVHEHENHGEQKNSPVFDDFGSCVESSLSEAISDEKRDTSILSQHNKLKTHELRQRERGTSAFKAKIYTIACFLRDILYPISPFVCLFVCLFVRLFV